MSASEEPVAGEQKDAEGTGGASSDAAPKEAGAVEKIPSSTDSSAATATSKSSIPVIVTSPTSPESEAKPTAKPRAKRRPISRRHSSRRSRTVGKRSTSKQEEEESDDEYDEVCGSWPSLPVLISVLGS